MAIGFSTDIGKSSTIPPADLVTDDPKPKVSKGLSEIYALQYAIAENALDEATIRTNEYRIETGEEPMMRENLSLKLQREQNALKETMMSKALTLGDVDTAENLIKVGIKPVPKQLVTETVAVEGAAAMRQTDSDQARFEFQKPEEQRVASNSAETRALAIMKVFGEVNDLLPQFTDPATPMDEVSRAMADFITSGKYVADLTNMIVPFSYAAQVAGAEGNVESNYLFDILAPGTQMREEASYIFEKGISDEEFVNRLESFKKKLGDRVSYAPLLYFSALYEGLFTSQSENPELLKLLALAEVSGKPNPLKDLYTPTQKRGKFEMEATKARTGYTGSEEVASLDSMMNDEYVQNALNFFDVASAFSAAMKTGSVVSKFFGNKAYQRAIVNAGIKASTDPSGPKDLRNLVSLSPDDSGITPGAKAEIDTLYAKAEAAMADRIVAARVKPTAGQIEEEVAVIKNDYGSEFVGAKYTQEGLQQEMRIYLGRKEDGSAYSTAESADDFGKSLGGDYDVIPNPNGEGFLVQVRRSVNESGWYTGEMVQEVRAEGASKTRLAQAIDKWKKARGFESLVAAEKGLRGYFWSPAVIALRRATTEATASALERAKLSAMVDDLLTPIASLNSKQQENLGEIINYGKTLPSRKDPDATGRWMNYNELDTQYHRMYGRGITDEEYVAYRSYQLVSDVAYELLNEAERASLLAQGMNTWRFKSAAIDSIIGNKVLNKRSINPEARILTQDGQILSVDEAAGLLKEDSNTLIRVNGSMDYNGVEISHVLSASEDVSTTGLDLRVLGYTEGGTRNYLGTWFAKSSRKGRWKNKDYAKAPRVHGVFDDVAKGEQYVKRMNDIRDVYNQYNKDAKAIEAGKSFKSIDEIRALASVEIEKIDSKMSLAKLEDLIASDDFDPSTEMKLLFDRDTLPGETGPNFERLQTYQRKGKLYVGNRGDHLLEDGEKAPLINPFVALSNQMGSVIQTVAYKNFMLREVGEWALAFRDFYKVPDTVMPTSDELLKYGVWVGQNNPEANRIRNIAESQRMYIKRMLLQPGTSDIFFNQLASRNAQKMSRLFNDSQFESVRTGRLALDANVVQSIRSAAYHVTLGFFNFGQLIMQGTAAVTATMIHPVWGVAAMGDYFPLRMAMFFDDDAKVIKEVDRMLSASKLKKRGEFIDLVKEYRRTGLHMVGRTDPVLDKVARSNYTKTGKAMDIASDLALLPLHEGERIGRIVSFGIARREAMEQVSKGVFKQGSPEYYNYIRAMTNKYTLNMMSGMETWWQRNKIASIPTQFMQYPFKYAEVFLGMNKQFTPQEHMRFIIGNTFMFGAYGVPFGPEITEVAASLNKENISQEEYERAMLGVGNELVNKVLGTDAAYSLTMAGGDFAGRFLTDLYSDGKPLAIAGGISYSLLTRTTGTLQNLWRIWSGVIGNENFHEGIEEPTVASLTELGSLLRSASNATRAYYVYKYGVLLDGKGNPIDAQTKHSALMTALGIRSMSEFRSWDIRESKKSREKRLYETAQIYGKYMAQADIAYYQDGDVDKFISKLEFAKTFNAGMDLEDANEVVKIATSIRQRDVDDFMAKEKKSLRYNPDKEVQE
jgi:hypothetical protein